MEGERGEGVWKDTRIEVMVLDMNDDSECRQKTKRTYVFREIMANPS